MSFSASQKNINEILSRNIIYCIPLNQRKYVWGENEWSEFFDDVFLIDQASNYNHFIGSVVFAKKTLIINIRLLMDNKDLQQFVFFLLQ